MGKITQRISHFRGINRSSQQNGLDVSYAYDCENVDISGGKLSSKVGSYRLATDEDVPPARPIPYFTNNGDYLILRKKFIRLRDHVIPYPYQELGGYEPYALNYVDDVVTDWDDDYLLIRGVGREYERARIDNVDTVICSGMLGRLLVDGSPVTEAQVEANGYDDYLYYRDFYVDGATCLTCVYYLDPLTQKIHCREFGSGSQIMKDKYIDSVTADSDGVLQTLTLTMNYSDLTDKQKNRALLDGIYLFHGTVGADFDEDDLENAFAWLKVTDIAAGGSGKAVFTVSTTRQSTDITTGSSGDTVLIRGECSNSVVTYLCMFYGRLFAAGHRSQRNHPRRLYWSRLPGDGRTVEDWTSDDASVDTSGGHVDIGDPSDGYITGMIVCGSQLLVFTQRRLWRLYGTSPSNYRLEMVCDLESMRISNPVEVNGTVYWLSRSGITYYNGSYVSVIDDNCSTRRLLESLPEYMQNAIYWASVHGTLFDNNLMFSIDATAHRNSRESEYDDSREYNECYIIRYNLETGDVIKYVVPATRYRQQFTDVLSKNFGMVDGNEVMYETRYFQALVHKPKIVIDPDTHEPVVEEPASMTMTQWKAFGMQEHGWYDGNAVNSVWRSDWDDLRAPDVAKKVQMVIMRGSGELDVEVESEINKELTHIVMPKSRGRVYEFMPRYMSGRSMRYAIMSENEFEVEPYMTMIYEAGGVR